MHLTMHVIATWAALVGSKLTLPCPRRSMQMAGRMSVVPIRMTNSRNDVRQSYVRWGSGRATARWKQPLESGKNKIMMMSPKICRRIYLTVIVCGDIAAHNPSLETRRNQQRKHTAADIPQGTTCSDFILVGRIGWRPSFLLIAGKTSYEFRQTLLL